MERKAATGAWTQGGRPFGYELDRESGFLRVKEEEAALVPMMFDLYVNKLMGARAIANRLNQHGHVTRKGKPWSAQSVLVTSHTHAAVEQALWAAVEPPTDARSRGPLFGSSYVEEGKVLKVGPLRQPKIPKMCHLDSYLEEVASERNEQVAALLVEQTSLRESQRT